MITTSAYAVASRFIGVKEIAGSMDNPQIMAMLKLDNSWPANDEVPWCSGFCNYIAWLLALPRSKALNARSWLRVGEPILLKDARSESDVIIISRGSDPAAGHVGFFAGYAQGKILLLAGNQGNSVSIAQFPESSLLGVRRLD